MDKKKCSPPFQDTACFLQGVSAGSDHLAELQQPCSPKQTPSSAAHISLPTHSCPCWGQMWMRSIICSSTSRSHPTPWVPFLLGLVMTVMWHSILASQLEYQGLDGGLCKTVTQQMGGWAPMGTGVGCTTVPCNLNSPGALGILSLLPNPAVGLLCKAVVFSSHAGS